MFSNRPPIYAVNEKIGGGLKNRAPAAPDSGPHFSRPPKALPPAPIRKGPPKSPLAVSQRAEEGISSPLPVTPPPPGCTTKSVRRPAASRRKHLAHVHELGGHRGPDQRRPQLPHMHDESWVAVDLSGADACVAIDDRPVFRTEKIKGIFLHPYRYTTKQFLAVLNNCSSPNTRSLQAAAATAVQVLLPPSRPALTMATGWPCHGQAPRRRPVASLAASVLPDRASLSSVWGDGDGESSG
jgi:hypothetical protein